MPHDKMKLSDQTAENRTSAFPTRPSAFAGMPTKARHVHATAVARNASPPVTCVGHHTAKDRSGASEEALVLGSGDAARQQGGF